MTTKDEWVRTCDVCGCQMWEGFLRETWLEYYCSKECLLTKYTWEQYLYLHEDNEDGDGEFYWTEWEYEPDLDLSDI